MEGSPAGDATAGSGLPAAPPPPPLLFLGTYQRVLLSLVTLNVPRGWAQHVRSRFLPQKMKVSISASKGPSGFCDRRHATSAKVCVLKFTFS